MFCSTVSFLEDARFLRQVSHVTVTGAAKHRPVGDVLAVQIDATAIGFDHAADHAKTGRLAGAIGAKQTDDFGLANIQIDTVDNATSAIGLL